MHSSESLGSANSETLRGRQLTFLDFRHMAIHVSAA